MIPNTNTLSPPPVEEMGYAGKYLKDYEWERYSFMERALTFTNRFQIGERSLGVPADAEQFGDVSFYQEGMNWDLYATKARAAIIRIGQGAWKDTEFEINYVEARRVGVALGGYWFYDDRYSPEQQAAIIIAALQGKYFEKELYIDWEVVYGGSYQGLKNVVKLMKLLDAAGLQVKAVGMYTGYYFFKEHSSWTLNPNEYNYLQTTPLWLAWYAAAIYVKVPDPWTEQTWTDWQWGTPSKPVWDWGQPTIEIDMSKSRYATTEFGNVYLGGTTPPGGGEMETTHIGTVLLDLNIRSGPGTSYPQSLPPGGILHKDDTLFGQWDKNGTQWFHFDRIVRATGTEEAWNAWCSAVNGEAPDPPYVRVEPYSHPTPDPTGTVWVQAMVEDQDADGNVIARYATDLVEAKKLP